VNKMSRFYANYLISAIGLIVIAAFMPPLPFEFSPNVVHWQMRAGGARSRR